MLPFNKESCRSEAVHDRNLFNVFFPNGTQKVKVDIILRVTITYCLLVKDKMKILSFGNWMPPVLTGDSVFV